MKVGALAGVGAIAMPNVSRAQTVTWKFRSTWPTKDIFHEFAGDFVKRVNEMSGGRLKIDLLASGAVVPAFQMQDAVAAGILDGGHGVSAYWYGKNKAFSLFGTPPALGWDADQLPRLDEPWRRLGDLYNELLRPGAQAQSRWLPSAARCRASRSAGSRSRSRPPTDFSGLKYRTVGLAADLEAGNGRRRRPSSPGGEIVPALERGVIDGAEFNNPSSDSILGFPDVAKVFMLQSYHQAAESFEIIFNKTKYRRAAGRAEGDRSNTPPSPNPPPICPGRHSTAIRRISKRCARHRASTSWRRRR